MLFGVKDEGKGAWPEPGHEFPCFRRYMLHAALQRYQVHPEHQKVVAHVKKISSNVVAVDFTG